MSCGPQESHWHRFASSFSSETNFVDFTVFSRRLIAGFAHCFRVSSIAGCNLYARYSNLNWKCSSSFGFCYSSSCSCLILRHFGCCRGLCWSWRAEVHRFLLQNWRRLVSAWFLLGRGSGWSDSSSKLSSTDWAWKYHPRAHVYPLNTIAKLPKT